MKADLLKEINSLQKRGSDVVGEMAAPITYDVLCADITARDTPYSGTVEYPEYSQRRALLKLLSRTESNFLPLTAEETEDSIVLHGVVSNAAELTTKSLQSFYKVVLVPELPTYAKLREFTTWVCGGDEKAPNAEFSAVIAKTEESLSITDNKTMWSSDHTGNRCEIRVYH